MACLCCSVLTTSGVIRIEYMLHLLDDIIRFGFTSSKRKGVSRKSFLKKENVHTALFGK